MFRRITKREAFARFRDNLPLVLCPRKMRPGYPFAMHSSVTPADWTERLFTSIPYRNDPEGVARHAWEVMYNEWAYYNASYETGYYAAYYVCDE